MLQRGRLTAVGGETGVGKSTYAKEAIRDYCALAAVERDKEPRVLVITPARTVSSYLAGEFGVTSYTDVPLTTNLAKIERVTCSLESFDRLFRDGEPEPYDLVVCDEWKQTWARCLADGEFLRRPVRMWSQLAHVLQSCGAVLAMDAYLTAESVQVLYELIAGEVTEVACAVEVDVALLHVAASIDRARPTVVEVPTVSKLKGELLRHARRNARLLAAEDGEPPRLQELVPSVVSAGSKSLIKELMEKLRATYEAQGIEVQLLRPPPKGCDEQPLPATTHGALRVGERACVFLLVITGDDPDRVKK